MLKAIYADTETSGLKPPIGICECAYIEFNPDDLLEMDRQHSLIDPELPISASASGIHRITDDMVEDKPTMEEWFGSVLNNPFAGHKLLFVAHNAQFDFPLMDQYLDAEEVIVLCTLKLAKHIYPDAENHKLATLKFMFGLGTKGAQSHGAMADVEDGMDLLRKMVKDTGKTIAELLDLQDMPRLLETMPFGKHKGIPIKDVPRGWVRWYMDQPETTEYKKDFDLVHSFKHYGLIKE
jgi:exodeoxyribonuclease X